MKNSLQTDFVDMAMESISFVLAETLNDLDLSVHCEWSNDVVKKRLKNRFGEFRRNTKCKDRLSPEWILRETAVMLSETLDDMDLCIQGSTANELAKNRFKDRIGSFNRMVQDYFSGNGSGRQILAKEVAGMT